MDDKELPPGDRFVPEGVTGDNLEMRRQALRSFLQNPEAAVELYPGLKNELITFFQLSSNPYTGTGSNAPASGKEAEYALWEAARQWAAAHAEN